MAHAAPPVLPRDCFKISPGETGQGESRTGEVLQIVKVYRNSGTCEHRVNKANDHQVAQPDSRITAPQRA